MRDDHHDRLVSHDKSVSTPRVQKPATPVPTTTSQQSEQGAGSDPVSRRTRWIVEAAVVVVATIFVLWVLRPSLLIANTLPAGGDLSLHDWDPAYLRQHVLPHLSGWSWDWFDGFPAYQFYPVLPPIVVVGLSPTFCPTG